MSQQFDEGGAFVSRAARAEFGNMLNELSDRAEQLSNSGLSICAAQVGLDMRTVQEWCSGRTSPQGDSTEKVRELVPLLRHEAGEVAEFDDRWAQKLEAAQREGDAQRGASKERDERRQYMAGVGAEAFTERPLQGPAAELKDLRAFVHSPGNSSYRWLQGSQRVRTSILLARLLLEQREEVDIIAYFASETEGWNRSDHFMAQAVCQLTKLAGRKPPAAQEPVTAEHLQMLFRAAAVRSARRKRRLLVVVDALDADAAWPGGPSIAALLPYEPVPAQITKQGGKRSLRVIVSSLPAAEPPTDVPADHPLRRREFVRALDPVAQTGDIERAALEELARLGASEVGRTLVGLLAMAGAGLRTEDLAALAGVDLAEVDLLLARARGHLLDDLDTYAFGTDDLLHTAREQSGPDLRAHCTGLLHAWADSWQARGWPASTPPYLLSHYPRQLCEPRRIERYVLDPRRQLRLVADSRLDEALAQLDLVPAGDGEDLGSAARVAVSRALLSRRARLVPRHFPELFALAGDATRARELALSAPDDADKAVRLADVAVVLHEEAAAREAAEWAVRALAAAPLLAEQTQQWEDLAKAGFALHDCGRREAARPVLRAVLSCEAVGWASRIEAAKLLGAETTDWLLRVAEHAEALIEGAAGEQAEALEIWGELIEEGVLSRFDPRFQDLLKDARPQPLPPPPEPPSRPKQKGPTGAATIRDRIEIFCADLDPSTDLTHVDLIALGVSALMPTRRGKARSLARTAREELLAALTAPETRSPADRAHLSLELSTTLTRVVRALLDVDHETPAKDLLDEVPEALRTDVLGDDIREQALTVLEQQAAPTTETDSELPVIKEALEKHPAHGRQLLAAAYARWEGHASEVGGLGWGLPLASALATTGHIEEAERLARRSPEPAGRAAALAAVSTGCAVGGYGAEAGRYARQAAASATDLPDDPAVRGLVAQAFAHAGDAGSAEAWASWERPRGEVREQVERSRIAVAVGLARHDPEAAARIVGELLTEADRVARSPRQRGRLLPRVAELLLALPDPRRPGPALSATLARLCAGEAESLQSWNPYTVLLNGLLKASGHFPEVPSLGDKLGHWERYMASTPLPDGVLPVAEWAVLHAFRGDVRTARDTAARAGTPGERAAALAAVAAYLAGIPAVVPATDGRAPQRRRVLRFLALADALGPDASRDEDQARRLVREVLTGEHWREHWRYALPLLPRLAPRSVPLLAELASAHTRPQPQS
ncbi:hypothetical protein ACIQNU_25225 [Streptomyces sp. NPDC091292]|uniref:hypothetical protein n=1 Tax=Streptomyces sp. NPDC091292 TaxID=3365991 RepID=UPI00381CC022